MLIWTTNDIALVAKVSPQTIRSKLRTLNFKQEPNGRYVLSNEECYSLLLRYYPKAYTIITSSGYSHVKPMKKPKITKTTSKYGKTYYYLRGTESIRFDTFEGAVKYRDTDFLSKANSYSEFCRNFFRKHNRSYCTLRDYRSIVETKIVPFFKDTEIHELTRGLLQDFVDTLTSNIDKTFTVLSMTLKELYMDDRIPKNYYEQLRKPKVHKHKKPKKALTIEQIKDFFRELKGTRMEHAVRLAFATGLREGELLALQWNDLEILNDSFGIVTVSKSYGRTEDGLGIKPTKTPESNREVYFNDPYVINLLRIAKANSKSNLWICENSKGTRPVAPDNFSKRYFRDIAKRAGIPFVVSSHHARVNFTSHALAKGISEKNLQEQLGHTSTELIRKVYGKAIGDRMTSIAEKSLYL